MRGIYPEVDPMCRFSKKVHCSFVAFLTVLLVFLSVETICASSSNDPQVQLKDSIDEILSILQSEELQAPGKEDERRQRVLKVINRIFDFRGMARSSLGRNWNDISAAEQDRFVSLFASLIEQRYIGKIDAYHNQKVIYKEQRVKNDRAKVYTAIVDKDLEIPIDYSLERAQDRWLIRDMRIENVSLVVNYRRDFNSIIKKEKFSGLVEKITAQLEKSEIQN
jgi:phospholipid transport system substrate-binding protein